MIEKGKIRQLRKIVRIETWRARCGLLPSLSRRTKRRCLEVETHLWQIDHSLSSSVRRLWTTKIVPAKRIKEPQRSNFDTRLVSFAKAWTETDNRASAGRLPRTLHIISKWQLSSGAWNRENHQCQIFPCIVAASNLVAKIWANTNFCGSSPPAAAQTTCQRSKSLVNLQQSKCISEKRQDRQAGSRGFPNLLSPRVVAPQHDQAQP